MAGVSRRILLGGSVYVTLGAGVSGFIQEGTAAESSAGPLASAETHDIILSVNGADRRVRVEFARDSRRSPPRTARTDGNEDRLQSRRVFGLHGLARRTRRSVPA